MSWIEPGRPVGMLGGGQLGRMFALAAKAMGYRVHVFSTEADSPAAQVADVVTVAPYEDLDEVRAFARAIEVLSFEFENVPAATAAAAEALVPVRPGPAVLAVCQHRVREKEHLRAAGLPVTPFARVSSLEEARTVAHALGGPGVLKTARSGYDGKGQRRVNDAEEAAAAFGALGGVECIYERLVAFERELSVVAARSPGGEFAHFGVFENEHANHILDLTLSPARISARTRADAEAIARVVMDSLAVEGVLCVEMFETPGGDLLVNELAPRPHNSGHLSIEAHETSQFEQQLRAVTGLPLGSTALRSPAAMANLLGDLWADGTPRFDRALALPGVHLHLYGKESARPGRKMGHLTALAGTAEAAAEKVRRARESLVLPRSGIE